MEKKQESAPTKKITIDKDALKEKLKLAVNQQLSLDKFVKSQPK